MTRQMMAILLVAAVVIGGALFGVVWMNQSRLLTLTGEFTNVRTQALTENATLVILDFKATNPSGVPFLINTIDVGKVETTGEITLGGLLSKREITGLFEYQKTKLSNPPMVIGEQIAAGKTRDGMVAARFELPQSTMKGADLLVRFRDFNGVVAEITGRIP